MQQLTIPGDVVSQRPRRSAYVVSILTELFFSRGCGQTRLLIYLGVKLIAKEKGHRVVKERGPKYMLPP